MNKIRFSLRHMVFILLGLCLALIFVLSTFSMTKKASAQEITEESNESRLLFELSNDAYDIELISY